MRFIHAADIHLDSPLAAVAARAGEHADTFIGATRRALTRLVDLAIREQVDFVLLAGDLWDGDWKDAHAGLFFVHETARLHAVNIPVVAIAGNHDALSATGKALSWPPNVRFLNNGKPETFRLLDGRVAVHGQGFANGAVTENLARGYPAAESGAFNIGLLHTALDGAVGHAPYAPCSVDDLRGRGYDYWALGHVHTARTVAKNPWIVYPGNLQGRHIRETGAKGCVLVTVADHQVTALRPVACDVARWAVAAVDLTGVNQWETAMALVRDQLAAAADSADGRPVAARVTFTGATPLNARLRANPQGIEAETLARALETGADLWIERVKIATRPPQNLAEPGADSLSALADLTARLADSADGERAALRAMLNDARLAWPGWLQDAVDTSEDDIIAGALATIAARLGGEDAA